MKKFELHLDALIAIVVVFALIIGFLLFQRYQYSDLLQENIDLAWENANLQVNLDYKTGQFDDCKAFIVSLEESRKESDPIESSD